MIVFSTVLSTPFITVLNAPPMASPTAEPIALNLLLTLSKRFPKKSTTVPNTSFIFFTAFNAASFILSQFLMSKIPAAITAPIINITGLNPDVNVVKAVFAKNTAPSILLIELTTFTMVIINGVIAAIKLAIFHAAKNDPAITAIVSIVS